MTLPDQVLSIGETLRSGGDPSCSPALLQEQEVFAAEFERIFRRRWMVADHASRLAGPRSGFVFDALTFSVVVTRDAGGETHALRNQCPHAGYPVVRSQRQLAGCPERLVCQFHGWQFGLDGRMLPPPGGSSAIDPSRAAMKRYPMREAGGLILVDLSRSDAALAEVEPLPPGVPAWLPDGEVKLRAVYSARHNWKSVLGHVLACATAAFSAGSPPPFGFRDAGEADAAPFGFAIESLFAPPFERLLPVGPLSYLFAGETDAAFLRVSPKSPDETDIYIAGIARNADAAAPVTGFRTLTLAPAAGSLDREFLSWYWHQMTAE